MLLFMTAPVMAATMKAIAPLIRRLSPSCLRIRKYKRAKTTAKIPVTQAASLGFDTGYVLPCQLELRSHTGSIPYSAFSGLIFSLCWRTLTLS